MHRQHRLIREAIAQRAAEVNRLAAQVPERRSRRLPSTSEWRGGRLEGQASRPRVFVDRSRKLSPLFSRGICREAGPWTRRVSCLCAGESDYDAAFVAIEDRRVSVCSAIASTALTRVAVRYDESHEACCFSHV